MTKSGAARVQKHRENLRKSGLRPIQIWVPDTRSKNFQKECQRQSEIIKNDPAEKEILKWLEETADHEGWE